MSEQFDQNYSLKHRCINTNISITVPQRTNGEKRTFLKSKNIFSMYNVIDVYYINKIGVFILPLSKFKDIIVR